MQNVNYCYANINILHTHTDTYTIQLCVYWYNMLVTFSKIRNNLVIMWICMACVVKHAHGIRFDMPRCKQDNLHSPLSSADRCAI